MDFFNDCLRIIIFILLPIASLLSAFLKPDQQNKFCCAILALILTVLLGAAIFAAFEYKNPNSNELNKSLEYLIVCTLAVLSSLTAGGFLSQTMQAFLEEKNISSSKNPTEIKGAFSGEYFQAYLVEKEEGDGASGGGKIIGILERFSITLLLIVGLHGSLPIIFAIKGLARYSEIKSGTLTAERFIIGTFASSLWAGLCALIPFLLVN